MGSTLIESIGLVPFSSQPELGWLESSGGSVGRRVRYDFRSVK